MPMRRAGATEPLEGHRPAVTDGAVGLLVRDELRLVKEDFLAAQVRGELVVCGIDRACICLPLFLAKQRMRERSAKTVA